MTFSQLSLGELVRVRGVKVMQKGEVCISCIWRSQKSCHTPGEKSGADCGGAFSLHEKCIGITYKGNTCYLIELSSNKVQDCKELNVCKNWAENSSHELCIEWSDWLLSTGGSKLANKPESAPSPSVLPPSCRDKVRLVYCYLFKLPAIWEVRVRL